MPRGICHWGPLLALSIIITLFLGGLYCIILIYTPWHSLGAMVHLGVYLNWAFLILYNFLRGIWLGPGYVPFKWRPAKESDTECLQFCHVCQGYKAPRAHHCSKCNRCVMKMDHHCPWINNCVGHYNMKSFTLFLFFVPLGCTHCAIILFLCLYNEVYLIAGNTHFEIHSSQRLLPFDVYHLIFVTFCIGLSIGEEKPNLPFLNRPSHSSVSGVFESPTLLVAGTTAATLIINCNTWEIIYVLDFKEPVLSSNEIDNAQYNLPTAGSYAFVNSYSNRVLCLIGSLFNNAVHVINIHLPNMEELPNKKIGRMDANELLSSRLSQSISLNTSGVCDTGALRPEQEMLTVLSSAPLCANSPLKAELVLKPPAGKSVKKTAVKPATARGKSSAIQDQPLTFKSKVKSSGYIDVPRTKMFSPKTNAAKLPKEPTRKSSTDRQTSILAKEYPLESEPPTQLKEKFPLTCQPTAISEIVYSGSGKHVACALANKTAHVLRVSPAGKQIVLTGHDGPVTSAKFSHDDRWLLTSSTDRTVRLWSPAVSDPLLVINTVKHNFTSDVGTKSKEKDNLPFSKEVSQSSFYYVDKFILLSCGNGLYLYKYHIDPVKDEIKRYQSNNKYKLVTMTQLERAQNITCFSCVNSFHSYIVFCCGSNKSIEVIDMNAGRVVRVILDAHTRLVHSICQNQGSAFAAHPTEAYDLFLTAAVTDGIKLWDLRTNKCVRRYEGHVNRSHPVGLAFSPCARYIATGSEDRSAYLFDIRGTSFSHRLTGHTEVVSDVAFHPARPELVAASLDGKLKFYGVE